MVTTRTARPGRPAFALLRDVIADVKAADPMAPVTVAVPSGYAGLAARRLLASDVRWATSPSGRAGLVNVRFLPLAALAEALGANELARAGRQPVTAAIRAEAIRGALATEPGTFRAVANHPATERAIDRAFTELRPCSAATLDRLAATSRRAADVVRLSRDVRARLSGAWYDEHDLFEAAARVAAAGGDDLAAVGHVVVFLPRRLAPAEAALMTALGPRATVVGADVPPDFAPLLEVAPARVVVVTDPDEEARAVVRAVSDRLAAGTPLHRMAILHPTAGSYGRLLAHHLDTNAIPWNGPGGRTRAESVVGRTLLGLLDLPERRWRRGDVVAWLASAPVVDPDRGGLVAAAEWDALSRRAGVVEGAEQWVERLDRYATTVAVELDAIDPDDEDTAWVRARRAARLEQTGRLRVFISGLIGAVAEAESAEPTWAGLSAWAIGLVDRFLGSEASWQRWPEDERAAGAAVVAAIRALAGLDALGLRTDPVTFRRAVDRALDAPAGRSGRFGDGVFLAPLGLAAGLDVDVVVVVGLAEGTLPSRDRGDALLPDREREAAGGELEGPASRVADERRDLALALAAANAESLLTFARADLRQRRARVPSRWLLECVRAQTGVAVDSESLLHLAGDLVHVVASHEAGLAAAGEPPSLHDRDVRDLVQWTRQGGWPGAHPLARAVPSLARGWECEQQRRGPAFTPFDGAVGAGAVGLPGTDAPLSATSLETYAACPRRYLLGRVLRVEAMEKPEEIQRLSALDRGTLVHAILEHYVLGLIDGKPRSLDDLLAAADEVGTDFEQRGLTGKSLWWQYDRRLLRRELTRLFDKDTNRPLAAELAFGDPGTAVTITTAGRTLAFRGMADRVDERDDGTLVVTDYKTGGADPYKSIEGDDPVAAGIRLQLPLYGLAARQRFGEDRPVWTRYWFISENANFRSIGYALDDRVLARFTEVVGSIADGIEAGAFPARPGDADTRGGWTNCRYCEFDELCPGDRARQWDRKRAAPELQGYVALAEGGVP